jgi:hypothetical protein
VHAPVATVSIAQDPVRRTIGVSVPTDDDGGVGWLTGFAEAYLRFRLCMGYLSLSHVFAWLQQARPVGVEGRRRVPARLHGAIVEDFALNILNSGVVHDFGLGHSGNR